MKATKKPAKKAAPAKKAPAKKSATVKKPAAKPAPKQTAKVEDLQKELKRINEMKAKLEGDKKELMKRCNEKDAELVKVRAENMNLKQKVAESTKTANEARAQVPINSLTLMIPPVSVVDTIKRSVPAKTNPFIDGIRPSCKR